MRTFKKITVSLIIIAGLVLITCLILYAFNRHIVIKTSIVVPYTKKQIWKVWEDPTFLARWDRSVEEVILTADLPIREGFTFQTIAPKKKGQKNGLKLSYRVMEYNPYHHSTVLLEQSPMFRNAKWITKTEDTTGGTLITNIMDTEIKFKYFYLVPVLLLNKKALRTDMEYLREALAKEIQPGK